MVTSSNVILWDIFEEYPNVSPKNLNDLDNLILEFKKVQKFEVAEFLQNWKDNIKRHVYLEWHLDDN